MGIWIFVTSYILILYCDEDRAIAVGSLGVIKFKKGYYYYVGSANTGVHRIKRHFRKEKKMRWHIDYIISQMYVVGCIMRKDYECELAEKIRLEFVPKFGCSDCKCKSHLFYSPTLTFEFLFT